MAVMFNKQDGWIRSSSFFIDFAIYTRIEFTEKLYELNESISIHN